MYQQLIIVGNVGKDPEMRYTPNGQPVTSFSVATSRQWTGTGGEKVKETTWFRVTAWGKLAETCNQFVTKGMRVLVDGRLMVDPKTGGPRTWQDRDGGVRASFEVQANQVRFLSSKDGQEGGHPMGETEDDQAIDPDGDDIPF